MATLVLSSIHAMLSALKVVTETYLGTSLNIIDLIIPCKFTSLARYHLDEELNILSLRTIIDVFSLALKTAIVTSELFMSYTCDFDNYDRAMTKLILSIIYSRSDSTITLFAENDCVIDELRFVQRLDLETGYEVDAHGKNQEHWQKFKSQVKKIATLLVLNASKINYAISDAISQLVLLEDRFMNKRSLVILEDILEVELVRKASMISNLSIADSIFAATNEVAILVKEGIENEEKSCLPLNCPRII